MARRPWGSPAQKAALAKAQRAAWAANRGRKKSHAKAKRNVNRRHYSSDANKRGKGVKGVKKNLTPYARINKHSQTAGVNSGTIIPGTGKRVAFGAYIRLENTNRSNALDATAKAIGKRVARKGTKPGAVRQWWNKNVTIDNPGVRADVGGAQVRLGTSRGSGATIIVRKGSHKTYQKKSQMGIKKYNTRTRTIRKQRRGRRRK